MLSEGIMLKRKDSIYRDGPSDDAVALANPNRENRLPSD